jgi:hypothetical protein
MVAGVATALCRRANRQRPGAANASTQRGGYNRLPVGRYTNAQTKFLRAYGAISFYRKIRVETASPSRNRLAQVILFLTIINCPAIAAEKPSAVRTVCFDAFVNWDFHHRQKLRGCKATAQAIQQTLHACRMRNQRPLVKENGTPDALRQFFCDLPGEKDCDISLVYLASHQSRAGEWDFTQGKLLPLNDLLADAKIPSHPHRIVILDTCFASAMQWQQPSWQRFAPISLFASTPSEETPEISFHTPQPVDFAHRYPTVFDWLKQCLGKKWDGKISFLGFVWVQTFLSLQDPPAEMRDWIVFLKKCQATARGFGEKVSKRDSSELILSID